VLNDTLYAIGNFSTPNHVAKFGIGQVNTTNDLSAVKFNAYPNPCTDQVIIEPRLNEQGLLFDSTGRVIFSKRIMNGVIDLSDISSGIYFLKAEEQSEMIKIVKR